MSFDRQYDQRSAIVQFPHPTDMCTMQCLPLEFVHQINTQFDMFTHHNNIITCFIVVCVCVNICASVFMYVWVGVSELLLARVIENTQIVYIYLFTSANEYTFHDLIY